MEQGKWQRETGEKGIQHSRGLSERQPQKRSPDGSKESRSPSERRPGTDAVLGGLLPGSADNVAGPSHTQSPQMERLCSEPPAVSLKGLIPIL